MRETLIPDIQELRCPSCRESLTLAQCADPLATCLACSAGHRFFVAPESTAATDTARASSTPLPDLEGEPPEAVAAFWLSNPAARSMLNDQLAELLRVILEDRPVSVAPEFSYCPLCGEPLAEYEQPDVWVVGLRCSNSHSWASRGGLLYGIVGRSRFGLQAEASDATIAQLVAGWLKSNPHLAPQLHESVRNVLRTSRFAPKGAA